MSGSDKFILCLLAYGLCLIGISFVHLSNKITGDALGDKQEDEIADMHYTNKVCASIREQGYTCKVILDRPLMIGAGYGGE